MKTLRSRIEQLEGRAGGAGQTRIQLILMRAGQKFALGTDRCVEILAESGFGPAAPVALLEFGNIPYGLDAPELERYLREHAAEICNRGSRISNRDPEGKRP